MKVVYNCDYGGYGLSHKAMLRYAELKGIKLSFERQRPEDYFFYYVDDEFFCDDKINRHDPILVQVIEELGDEANGNHSKLAFAEVKPGEKYMIQEWEGGGERVLTFESPDWITAE